ncbi:LuxR family transcriptional regulator [Mycobacterium sp. UM_CSW]|uniref:helix-turn-helix transcriptional regulator n=1 Tax=Mycobacterium sp. UM_CSW TaxID=1370119 RepID=UPI0004079FE9|nr:LuxR family transcriptional regulator [Mycobacterium sp. UM_CSW]
MTLRGRRLERSQLDQLLAAVRAGQSRALVVHGEAGVGKTALLEYLARRASQCRIARAAGVQSEMELPFAGLHQLCAPMLGRLTGLPAPQQEALRTAFGMSQGPTPDPFFIGLAVLGLLSDVAEDRPLLCIIDDHQWLDASSAQLMAFVARRLGEESVGIVFGTRVPGPELRGLPDMMIGGLPYADAKALLQTVLPGTLDIRVRDQIVAETRGNPLALLELPRGLSVQELAGGFGLPAAAVLSDAVEETFRRRSAALPDETRRLLLVAAADPTGDPVLVWRAAQRLGVGVTAAAAAAEAGLAEMGTRVQFRHPLVRSVAYWSASPADRRAAHAALAAVTDPTRDPDRRVWHLAEAATGPDENLAAELVRSADTARARGGLAAAAAFLERAARLTADPERQAERALAAAERKLEAGAFGASVELLAMAESYPLDEFKQARVDLVRGQLAFATSRGGDAPLLLLQAAKRFEPIDAGFARATYLNAINAAAFAGRLASRGGDILTVARAAATAPPPRRAALSPDYLLDGLASNFVEGYPAGVPALRRALVGFGDGMSTEEELRWMWLINLAALHLWDDTNWDKLSRRYLELVREAGALTELPLALSTRALMLSFTGDLTVVEMLVDEQRTVTDATGSSLAPYSGMRLAALLGRQADAMALIELTANEAPQRGEGISIAVAQWTKAVLHNGLGDYAQAQSAAEQALYHQEYPRFRYPGVANWAVAELIEAAVRNGDLQTAATATDWLTEMTQASGTAWAMGVEARSRALQSEGDTADGLYQAALGHFGCCSVRTELARARLIYGEWLRREGRRGRAREQLHMARDMFESMGMEAFAGRAARELVTSGEAARRQRAPSTTESAQLTAQEVQVARMARDGFSNPEIGGRLFISTKTVQYHLRKVFTKLGISSRSQLGDFLD